ncbi:hypothetical protein LNKW23_05370 [Paralimibaculum aggregatum]|uniref:Histidine phosphotransferase ChpT C-terminal domain-containing protein n=1 Tax=Paralimibaculum aggregatum TaxID=3036245 RepID=A0ABQ6LGW3_9RHOB|nr:hypothetical protein [Limibaculum sp. NKW23]GMG81324.1 hypothetical protein LNKW23_05370 [Limibaculum sp. NKW23]
MQESPITAAPPASLDGSAALAQALASRICHDLVSPVGAITNGVDLVQELGSAGAEEIAMIGQSAARAATMLAFHRLAFGAAGADAPPMARPALAALLSDMLAGSRVRVDLDGAGGPALPRPAARAVALATLCARGLLGMQGRLMLTIPAGGAWPARIAAEGAAPAHRAARLALLARAAAAAPGEDTGAGTGADKGADKAAATGENPGENPGAEPGRIDPRLIEFHLLGPAVAAAGAALALETAADGAALCLRAA